MAPKHAISPGKTCCGLAGMWGSQSWVVPPLCLTNPSKSDGTTSFLWAVTVASPGSTKRCNSEEQTMVNVLFFLWSQSEEGPHPLQQSGAPLCSKMVYPRATNTWSIITYSTSFQHVAQDLYVEKPVLLTILQPDVFWLDFPHSTAGPQ